MVSAAKSSGLLKRNTPLGAFPTAVLYPFTIYAVFIFLSLTLSGGKGILMGIFLVNILNLIFPSLPFGKI
jgi:hypothetical protein